MNRPRPTLPPSHPTRRYPQSDAAYKSDVTAGERNARHFLETAQRTHRQVISRIKQIRNNFLAHSPGFYAGEIAVLEKWLNDQNIFTAPRPGPCGED